MEHNSITPERMREIEIFGVPALFTDRAIPPENIYPGLFRYELQAGIVADRVEGKILGTILTPIPIFLHAEDTQREIQPGDLVLDTDAGYYTPSEFEEKYLSPDYRREERCGKEN